jgi:hypothetical protein
MNKVLRSIGWFASALLLASCGGGNGLPNGSVVNSPGGGPTQTPTKLVSVKVTITIPASDKPRGIRPDYVSPNTESLAIALSSVNGEGVSGVSATVINTLPHDRGCKQEAGQTVCTATASGSPGTDVFAVTTYAGINTTGSVLSVGTVEAKIAGSGSGVQISNALSLTLDGVIATMKLVLSPNGAKRGEPVKAAVALSAYDATGAQIVGASDFSTPVSLTIQGDADNAFVLHAGGHSGTSLDIVKPTSGITLDYDGNAQASSVTLQASAGGASGITASASFALRGKQPPPPVGTIYALNLGSDDGKSATVTEYGGTATGNAAPERTLQLSSKLYARSIALDASGNLYVGYFDSPTGFSISDGTPDAGNEIAIYASGASGGAQPTAYITADSKTQTKIFPLYIAFAPSGNLVTYGASAVDGNGGNDAVLIYASGSTGPVAPADAWDFSNPTLRYAGPTGLALDSSGNFYVNGALHSPAGPEYGTYIALASDDDNPAVNPSRTIPWDSTTELTPQYTTNVSLSASNEIYIANSLIGTNGYPPCQGLVNVFAAGATGGVTDVKPLRVLRLGTVETSSDGCIEPNNPLEPYFPSVALYGTTLFIADDFNNAIDAFAASGNGSVSPRVRIVGSSTGLNGPIMLVITSQVSGQAKARSAKPH